MRTFRILSLLLGALGCGAMLLIGLDTAVRLEWLGKLPEASELQVLQNDLASEVYSIEGELLGKYFLENRTEVRIADLPPAFIDALIATEDVRFWTHDGVDLRSLGRVMVRSLLLGDASSGGGST
ncbi:MAG: hypothetical protein D6722_06830, partial [Bacteroidetes bacterium]